MLDLNVKRVPYMVCKTVLLVYELKENLRFKISPKCRRSTRLRIPRGEEVGMSL
jgi:hypothetical protein